MITDVLCVVLKIQQYWYIVCGVTIESVVLPGKTVTPQRN